MNNNQNNNTNNNNNNQGINRINTINSNVQKFGKTMCNSVDPKLMNQKNTNTNSNKK